MRTIWIVRHGEPEFPGGVPVCLGRGFDPPLSERGRTQAQALQQYFAEIGVLGIFCSPSLRSLQTAEIIAGGVRPVYSMDYLSELDAGEWDGLPFERIREQYPELYERRGSDNALPPPGGETCENGFLRLHTMIGLYRSDCLFVTHAGVNRALVAGLRGIAYREVFSIPQPYGCINKIVENDGQLSVESVGVLPEPYPSDSEIQALYHACETPPEIVAHCRAVAALVLELADSLAGVRKFDMPLLYTAALLHDLMKPAPDHPQRATAYLILSGYPAPAGLIANHHDLAWEHIDALDETALLFYCDKLVDGEQRVTLEERFAESLKRCDTEEARQAHERRRYAAFAVRDKINEALSEQHGKLSLPV